MTSLSRLWPSFLALLIGALPGCARKDPVTVAPSEKTAPIEVTLKATSPLDLVLEWKNPAPRAAGHVVEYINRAGDEWVILGFFPPDKHTFHHPRLAPGTPYQYRVRPFYGPVSNPVEVTIAA